jgi:hypothetical protein
MDPNLQAGIKIDLWFRDVVELRSCFGMMDMVTAARGTVSVHEYPPPPSVYYARWECTGQHHPTGPGVYFALDRKGVCKYVGKAKNLKRRLQSHDKIDCVYDFIAWIEFPLELLDYAEFYYIGLMKPYANFNGDCPEFNPFNCDGWIVSDDENPFE